MMSFLAVEPGEEAWYQIKKHFGEEVFHNAGTLNRGKLGDIIFSDDSKRKLLNSITHPQIHKRMMRKLFSYFVRGGHFRFHFTFYFSFESYTVYRISTFVRPGLTGVEDPF